MSKTVECPVCRAGRSSLFTTIAGYAYYVCGACDSIHISPGVLEDMDAGIAQVGEYGEAYWEPRPNRRSGVRRDCRCAVPGKRSCTAGGR